MMVVAVVVVAYSAVQKGDIDDNIFAKLYAVWRT